MRFSQGRGGIVLKGGRKALYETEKGKRRKSKEGLSQLGGRGTGKRASRLAEEKKKKELR